MTIARYQKIKGDSYRNIWVVGDIHGQFSLLMNKISQINFNINTDLLISVGDNIDRGKENIPVLRLLDNSWFISVIGNHEEMSLEAFDTQDGNFWYKNGGSWFFSLNQKEKKESIERLLTFTERPHVIEVEKNNKKYVISHADYPKNDYHFDKIINIKDILWSQDRILNSKKGKHETINGADLFIFGHSQVHKITTFSNQVYIDTGLSEELSLFKIK